MSTGTERGGRLPDVGVCNPGVPGGVNAGLRSVGGGSIPCPPPPLDGFGCVRSKWEICSEEKAEGRRGGDVW